MDEKIVAEISSSLAELSSCIEKSSVKVKFSDDQSGKYLSTAIQDALTEYRKKLHPDNKKDKDDKIKNTNSLIIQTKATEKAAEATKSLTQQLENGKDVTTKLNESLDTTQDAISQAKESVEKSGETIKTISLKVVSVIGAAVKAMVTRTIDETAARLNWVQQLNDAGVKLRGGFDETFTELSNLSKRSHDEFTKLLTSNSNMIARMNTMGLRGENEIASMSQAIVGKYGYTVKSSDSIIKYMLDSRIKYMTEEEIQTMNLSSEMDILAKNLRRSSAAFGKNTEQILAETKAREDDIADKLLEKKYGQLYKDLKLAGIPQDNIKMLLTGVPNANAIRNIATNPALAYFHNYANKNKNALTNPETSLQTLYNIMNSPVFKKLRDRTIDTKNLAFLTILPNDSAFVKSALISSNLQPPDMRSANALSDNETAEIKAINALTQLKTSLDMLRNTINDKLSSSLDLMTSGIKSLSNIIGASTFALKLINSTLYKALYGTLSVAGDTLKDIGLGTLQLLAFSNIQKYGFKGGMKATGKDVWGYGKKGLKKGLTSTRGKYAGKLAIGSLGVEAIKSFVDEKENPAMYGTLDTLSSTAQWAAIGSMIAPGWGTAIGALAGFGMGVYDNFIKNKSPAESGVNTNNYNPNGTYDHQRTIYTDSEKESNDKATLASSLTQERYLEKIANDMSFFVNSIKFNTEPLPYGVGTATK